MSDAETRSKYNVDRDKEKRTYDDIVFDSILEMRYYRDVILPQWRSGDITHFELQKEYELQPKYRHDGKLIRAIVYVADFYVEYSDGHVEVVDTKGCADSVAKIKRKMFMFKFPELEYKWITYVKKFGGWVDFDEAARLRREAKREKLKEMKEREEENGEESKS